MISAKLPNDEKERLKALFEYDILDTEAEKVFDDLTKMASEICQTPIALISLIDPDRQWFKAKVGLDAPETSRDIAFCAHAIHQRELFEVNDASKDERFFDNPLVTSGPEIRFYAGAQLVTPSGHAIGTLCAIDKKPQQLNQWQRSALETLSREVISQLELRVKIRQLEAASQHKSEFLSTMSHELRTPLNAIVNFSQLMLGTLKQHSGDKKLLEYAGYIDSASKHLLNLVNSVLDMSKIEQGKMEVTHSNVQTSQLFERLQGLLSVQAMVKSIQLDFLVDKMAPTQLVADEAKLQQIVINLVGNAIKYTAEGGNVEVSVAWADNQLAIRIADNGYGISKENQKRLFSKFEQFNKSQNIEGSGLGLAITKSLVDLLGGTIDIQSQENKGTTVSVKLPAERAIPHPTINQSDDVQLTTKGEQQVLLVEDNFINQQVAIAIFKTLGITLDLAETGEKSVEMAQNKAYDIIFMDLHLPGIDGAEAALQIHHFNPQLPIVVLTADVFYSLDSVNEKVEEPVFDDHLSKPLETDKLVAVLNKHLS